MCVITNENHVVVSLSIIPGVGNVPETYHVYFPFMGDLPLEGSIYKPLEEKI